jgi:cell division protein ZapA (FtsZ GTPase activity inhibitor)
MSEGRRVELTFLGQALALRTEASPDYVRKLAKFVEERVAELKRAGVKDPLKALSLAALDIADELHRARDEKAHGASDVGARLGALVALLDKAAPKDPG